MADKNRMAVVIAKATIKELFHNAPKVTKQMLIGIRNLDIDTAYVADAEGYVWKLKCHHYIAADAEGNNMKMINLSITMETSTIDSGITEFNLDEIANYDWHLVFDEDAEWLRDWQ